MRGLRYLKLALAGGASAMVLAGPAAAKVFDIPDGDLSTALSAYMKQAGVEIVYLNDTVRGHRSKGAKGDYTETAALTQVLSGTGFMARPMPMSNAIGIVPQPPEVKVAQATKSPSAPPPQQSVIETVVVTAQHKSENIQTVPISITALSQQQLTDRQIAGGPDLLRDVPNMNFSKTNFSGYNIELRGIGTQAISVTTDPAVAVAFNDTPFIRNHFFEQEFYDLDDAEVLLGPQGTLYGRNATAGVVNLKSALPTDTYEAMLSADIGNYDSRRYEGMLNIPIVGDKLDVRFAGEWTKREGYTEDTTLDTRVDGRDLWSGRMTIGWNPTSDFHSDLIWEHFSEDDDRLRSGKQLCETAQPPTSVNGVPVPPGALSIYNAFTMNADYLSQGCQATSLYSPSAFQVPYGFSLPYAIALGVPGDANQFVNPYAETTQSTNLRQIQSTILPTYKAKNDTLEFNATYNINSALTLTSQTGYNQDFLWSTEDYNRFDTSPGIFAANCGGTCYGYTEGQDEDTHAISSNGTFCDPQLGCSSRIVAEDLSDEHAWQLSQEFRLASNFSGPFNFSFGANYLHYETEENYYVFINSLTLASVNSGNTNSPAPVYVPGVTDNQECLQQGNGNGANGSVPGYQNPNPILGGGQPSATCIYIDPNPIGSLDNKGHNYFLSQNPYTLNSYAMFGETYYNITSNLKLTEGVRWTVDQKHFTDIPSEVFTRGYGYPVTGIVNQQWSQPTGRAVLDWTPDLSFTDQTLIYASASHGYKAGGADPPGAVLDSGAINVSEGANIAEPVHPLTFKPEYIEAFELGTKNTLLDNSLTLNGDIFYYNYTGYQISTIVDRTSINNNYNAHVEGAEVTANWEPLPGLKFNFAGGWEDTAAAGGDAGIDLMDRTAGMPGWMVVKPFVTDTSNCILPTYVVAALLQESAARDPAGGAPTDGAAYACNEAYVQHLDPATLYPYQANPSGTGGIGYPYVFPIPVGYIGYNPNALVNGQSNNDGEGFAKNLAGHALPNAPPFTVSLGSEYSMPVSNDWVATLRGDFYWQADTWARIFNDNPYDRIRGYTNVNVAMILTSANGWQVMGYVKNVFDVTAITGDFLNSDDSGLTTNVFLTDPRLYGIRVTKHLDEDDGFWGKEWSGIDWISDLFADADNGKPQLWIELGGQMETITGQGAVFSPGFLAANPASTVLWKGTTPLQAQQPPMSFGEEAKVSFEPDGSDWVISAAIRYGKSSNFKEIDHQTGRVAHQVEGPNYPTLITTFADFSDTQAYHRETHSIMDFVAGKDVGLGMFGLDGSSILSGGIRIAQFKSRSSVDMRARPDLHAKYVSYPQYDFHLALPHFHNYHATGQASRKFLGVGPSISWNGSAPVTGNPDSGISFDWGANAAFLFGKQKTRAQHYETATYRTAFNGNYSSVYHHPIGGHDRNRSIVVPNLGGFAGVSYRYQNAKISFGYRADLFFGAIDGGIDARKSETLNMSGPFATISFGLGG